MKTLDQFDVTIAPIFEGLVVDKDKHQMFKWRVTLTYQGRSYHGDYTAGLAHCTRSMEEWRKKTGQHGSRPKARVPNNPTLGRALKPFGPLSVSDCEGDVYPLPPTKVNYLECLQSDARAGEHLLFEDFCSEFGCDTDSRASERVWRLCQETRGKLQHLFGADFEDFMAAEPSND